MDTFLCDKCSQLFNGSSGAVGECPYCNSKYFIWITYSGRPKKEVEELLKRASLGPKNKDNSGSGLSSGTPRKGK